MTTDTAASHATRAERAARILDAAATLMLRWGYQRVTIDDIAGEAGVGTGTVYLHWKTKEALFETVLLRELQAIWLQVAQNMRDDPTSALLHRCLSSLLQAVKQRPLARALFTRDTTLLGKLARSNLVQQLQHTLGADELLSVLRELRLLRTDQDPAVQMHAFSAIWTGFVLIDQFIRAEDQAPIAVQVDALILTISRTFEPEAPPDTAWLRDVVAPRLIALFEQASSAVAQQVDARLIA